MKAVLQRTLKKLKPRSLTLITLTQKPSIKQQNHLHCTYRQRENRLDVSENNFCLIFLHSNSNEDNSNDG